jgi:branched-chain amino acid transport system permease protein
MADIVERQADEAAAPAGMGQGAGNAIKDAGIAFLLALALLGSLVGLRTDSAAGGLTITVHFAAAAGMAATVAAIRFLFDIVVWRPLDGGRTRTALIRIFGRLRVPAVAAALVTGLLLYCWGGARTAIIEWASNKSWLAGKAADFLTFACIAAFILVLAMAGARVVRLGLAFLSRNWISRVPEALIAPFGREFAPALPAIAIVLPFLAAGKAQGYLVDTGTQILIYVMLGWGLNVVVGLAGLLDLGYVAFYAVGAYSYAILSTHFGWSFWACLPLAGILAAVWGITLGFPVLRLRGDYLAIVTLAFGEIIRIVIINWSSLTEGPNGINRVPRPSFFGLPFERTGDSTFHGVFGIAYDPSHRLIFLYYIVLVLIFLTNYITLRLRRLPIGRAWEALREDEIACRSLGINTVITKLSAFAIGAMFGGIAGVLFAAKQGGVAPESFTFNESALVLAIVVLGGLGNQLGVLVAAVVLAGSAERFRDLEHYRMLIFGMSMVVVMLWRPRGLMSGRTPSASLPETYVLSASFVKKGHG